MDIRNELQEARACVLSQRQYAELALDEETFATVSRVLENLTVARNLLMLTIEDPDAARGLLRAAAGQCETARTVLDTWRGDGLATVVPTTEFEG